MPFSTSANRTRTIVAILFMLLAPAAARAQAVGDPALRDKLLELIHSNQSARREAMPALSAPGGVVMTRADDPAIVRVKQADSIAAAGMAAILEAGVWPGKNLVGEEASHAAASMVNMSRSVGIKRKALALMTQRREAGDVIPADFATLTDQVRVASGQPQVYGTVLQWVNNGFAPAAIDDSANVDARRATLGLGSLADYVRDVKVNRPPADEPTRK